jgi:predicted DNA binding CopG/RHH family protein
MEWLMTKSKKVREQPYFDAEEREDIEALLRGEYVQDQPLKERMKALKKLAANTSRKKPVTLRLYEKDITSLKAIAMQEGMPYQTLLASVVHKFVASRN